MTGPATPLPVTFDQQIFAMQQRGGISRYFVELMRRFEADPALGVEPVTPFRSVRNEHLLDVYPDRFARGRTRWAPAAAARARARPRTRRRRGGGAALHVLRRGAPGRGRGDRPTVSTVHDMIPELFSAEFDGTNPHLAKRRFVESSTSLICVSETTRRDLIAIYGAARGRHQRGPPRRRRRVPPAGRRQRRAAGLVRAVRRSSVRLQGLRRPPRSARPGAAAWPTSTSSASAGARSPRPEQARARELHLAERIHHLRVSDADLPGVYARALALAYPSRYEGFGLPVLEAMAAGCPVVLTDIAIFHETADTAADYFPAGDSAALADRLMRLCNDAAPGPTWSDAGGCGPPTSPGTGRPGPTPRSIGAPSRSSTGSSARAPRR